MKSTLTILTKKFIELACDMGLATCSTFFERDATMVDKDGFSACSKLYSEKISRHETCLKFQVHQSPSLAHPEI